MRFSILYPRSSARRSAPLLLAVLAVLTAGCSIRQNMYDQPKFEPYEETSFFGDNRSARELIPGVVPVGHLDEDDHFYRGKMEDGSWATEIPVEITGEVLARGANRFAIYCTPCHGQSGYGEGMVVQRGYKRPPSYHTDDLRSNPDKPVGYMFDVVSNGFGVMSGYSYPVKAPDRWAVIAYVRALQLSQNAAVADLPEEDQKELAALIEE